MDNNDYGDVYQLEQKILDTMERLDIKTEDDPLTLICKAPRDTFEHVTQWLEYVKKSIRKRYAVTDVTILLIDDIVNLEKLDDEMIDKLGLQRKVEVNEEDDVVVL